MKRGPIPAETVRAIREWCLQRKALGTVKGMARKYGITPSAIRGIREGTTYRRFI